MKNAQSEMDFTNNHGAGYGESVWKSLPIDISRIMVLSTSLPLVIWGCIKKRN